MRLDGNETRVKIASLFSTPTSYETRIKLALLCLIHTRYETRVKLALLFEGRYSLAVARPMRLRFFVLLFFLCFFV